MSGTTRAIRLGGGRLWAALFCAAAAGGNLVLVVLGVARGDMLRALTPAVATMGVLLALFAILRAGRQAGD